MGNFWNLIESCFIIVFLFFFIEDIFVVVIVDYFYVFFMGGYVKCGNLIFDLVVKVGEIMLDVVKDKFFYIVLGYVNGFGGEWVNGIW